MSETPNLDRLRAWLDDSDREPSVRRYQRRPRARLRGVVVGGLGRTGDRIDVQYTRSHRGKRHYDPVFERHLAAGELELMVGGRYVDWREVVR